MQLATSNERSHLWKPEAVNSIKSLIKTELDLMFALAAYDIL